MSAEQDPVQDIVGRLPIDQLARQVGADEQTTRSAVEQIVPALLGGMQANAQDPAGQDSLIGALGDHRGDPPTVDSVDTTEGGRIVDNVFGANTDQVAERLGGLPGGSNDLVRTLLPILAPIVLNYLAGRVLGRQTSAQPTQQPTQQPVQQPTPTGADAGEGGDLGDLLASVLGGALGSRSGMSGELGKVLGGLLGGGKR